MNASIFLSQAIMLANKALMVISINNILKTTFVIIKIVLIYLIYSTLKNKKEMTR